MTDGAADRTALEESSLKTSTDQDRPNAPGDSGSRERLLGPGQPPPCRPVTARSSTEPNPADLLHPHLYGRHKPGQALRHTSPYRKGSHARSRSYGTLPASLTRAHSMPAVHTSKRHSEDISSSPSPESGTPSPRYAASAPMRIPVRVRSPFRSQQPEDSDRGSSMAWWESAARGSAIEAIREDSELDIRPRASPLHPSLMPPLQAMVPRSASSARRPPLHSVANAPQHSQAQNLSQTSATDYQNFTSNPQASSAAAAAAGATLLVSPGSNSPSLAPQQQQQQQQPSQKYNESHPLLHHWSSSTSLGSSLSFSSIPSTPTSARSRSPSISSLDPIEDAPDLELESEILDMERLQLESLASADGTGDKGGDGDDEGTTRRRSLDAPTPRVGFGFGRFGGGAGGGGGGGNRDQRKRWSLCGGERRADLLDLETIWED